MRRMLIIFKKELKDMLRDRRTIFFMLVFPMLLIYLMLNLSMKLSLSQVKKSQEKTLQVALISNGNAAPVKKKLQKVDHVIIDETIKEDQVTDLIQKNKLDFAIVFAADFDQQVKENKTGKLKLYFRASLENERAKKRIIKPLNDYKDELLGARLSSKNLNKSFINTMEISEQDISTLREKVGERLGGMIPYFLIIFCFIGSMYPAIDLAAGEKERGTIETLLVSPASRFQIVMGKFLVIVLAGVMTAVVSFAWMFFILKQNKDIPQEQLSFVLKLVELKSIFLILSMLLPLCVFFAAILLSASVFAKSYKEAQSIISPLNILIIFPVFIGIFPGIKLNTTTALIPILNVSLASKDIISGTIKPLLLCEVYLSLIFIAAIGIYFCSQWFKREDIIFRY